MCRCLQMSQVYPQFQKNEYIAMCRFHKLKFFRILKVVAVQMVIRGAVQFIRAGSQCRHTLFNPFWTMTQLYNRCKFTSIHTHDGGPHYKDKLLERFVMSLCLALAQAATQPLKLMTFDLLSFSQWQVEPRYLYTSCMLQNPCMKFLYG